ncbi:CapA family protein [Bacteroidota bacterium]|nr:CapA family protein [Bacteroidota bacterium]
MFHILSSTAQEMSLLFLGDIMGHGPQIKSAWNDSLKKYDYNKVFQPVEDIISSVDFAIANLEVTLAGPPFDGYPQFSSPDELAEACKNNGIDVLVTANNHSCDRGSMGIVRTNRVLDSLEILHTGTFSNQQNRDSLNLLVLEKEGIRIGLLNYTYGTNGIPFHAPTYVNLLDSSLIKKDLKFARTKNLDKLIVFVHWGAEYQDQPNLYQKNFNQFFKRQGVDIVIGSHPHVVQPMHYIKNNDKEFLTVYSLGNFVSNQRDFRKDGGVMFRCSIVKRDKASISDKEYILTWVNKFYKNEKWYYEVLPCSNKTYGKEYFSRNEDYAKMQVYSDHAKNLFADYNINIQEGFPYPKIHLQKYEPQELRNQKNTKWIKKLNLFKYRKNKNAK